MSKFARELYAGTALVLMTAIGCGDSPETQKPAAQKSAPISNGIDAKALAQMVKDYDDQTVPPEKKNVLTDAKGEKYIKIDVPGSVITQNPADTAAVAVYKQLDGEKTEIVTEENSAQYHSSNNFIYWYMYHRMLTGGSHTPSSGGIGHSSASFGGTSSKKGASPYVGYYTHTKEAVHSAAQRATTHNALKAFKSPAIHHASVSQQNRLTYKPSMMNNARINFNSTARNLTRPSSHSTVRRFSSSASHSYSSRPRSSSMSHSSSRPRSTSIRSSSVRSSSHH